MPNNKQTRKNYYLDNQDAVRSQLPKIRHFEFNLLIHLYKEAGYEVARKYLNDLKQFHTERNDPNRVKPKPTNLNYKKCNPKGITRITKGKGKQGKASDLVGLEEIALEQQQTALTMLRDYGIEISQNYVNFCLKIHQGVEYQNEQTA